MQVVTIPSSHPQVIATPKEASMSWTGCPERPWLPCPGKCSRLGGIGIGETWDSEWHLCPGQGDRNEMTFQALPTQTIL